MIALKFLKKKDTPPAETSIRSSDCGSDTLDLSVIPNETLTFENIFTLFPQNYGFNGVARAKQAYKTYTRCRFNSSMSLSFLPKQEAGSSWSKFIEHFSTETIVSCETRIYQGLPAVDHCGWGTLSSSSKGRPAFTIRMDIPERTVLRMHEAYSFSKLGRNRWFSFRLTIDQPSTDGQRFRILAVQYSDFSMRLPNMGTDSLE